VLSEKVKNNLLVVLDELVMEKPKTKVIADLFKKIPAGKASRLILNSGKNTIYFSARNIQKTGVIETRNLNVFDFLNYKYILTTKDGVKEIEKVFSK